MVENTINHKLTVKEGLRGRTPMVLALMLILGCGLYQFAYLFLLLSYCRKKSSGFFKLFIYL